MTQTPLCCDLDVFEIMASRNVIKRCKWKRKPITEKNWQLYELLCLLNIRWKHRDYIQMVGNIRIQISIIENIEPFLRH